MTFYVMLVLIVGFVLVVVYFAKAAVLEFEQRADEDVLKVKAGYLQIIRTREAMTAERKGLEAEAERIFNLYDLTRDSTKTFSEEEAFETFKEHLTRQLRVKDCRLLKGPLEGAGPREVVPEGYRFFPLKARNMVLGELAYEGIRPEEEETFAILAHQFAIALRRIRLYKEVERLAITDSLTGLHTRRYFMERFQEECARSKARGFPLSLLMIDVDHFKKINDHHGHLTGDRVLSEIGHVLLQAVREIDIVGRFGGEEICVVLPETDKPDALLVSERIRQAVAGRKIHVFDAHLKVTVSIGVATFPADAQKGEELLDKADWAMYRAKKNGRNRVMGFRIYDEK
ncbi:MAG: GGDEF domain-containing protein [Elusimicrobia bacterium]|nr:GGDEF domain-containing protein [Elusimicrobiota bacterium]